MILSVSENSDRSRAAIKQLTQQIRAKCINEVARSTREGWNLAKRLAPKAVGASFGKGLVDQIAYSYSADKLTGTFGSYAPYAQFVEGVHHNYTMGRAPGKWPPVDPIAQWVYFKFSPATEQEWESITFLVRRKIGTKGTPAQPHIKPARDQIEPVFRANVDRVIRESILKSGLRLS